MICQKCKNEFQGQYDFCPLCGTRQTPQTPNGKICPACGSNALPTDQKCSRCGHLFFGGQQSYKRSSFYDGVFDQTDEEDLLNNDFDQIREFAAPRKKNNTMLFLLVGGSAFMTIVVVVVLIFALKMVRNRKNTADTNNQTGIETVDSSSADASSTGGSSVAAVSADGGEVIENPSQDTLPAGTYNLYENRSADLVGTIETENGERIFKLETPISVYSATSDAQKSILLKDIKQIGFKYSHTKVKKEELESQPDGTKLQIKGNLSVVEQKVLMFPDEFVVLQGNAASQTQQNPNVQQQQNPAPSTGTVPANNQSQPASTEVAADTSTSEYVVPYSSDRIITQDELSRLSLQQLNYAKNEIYAKHGRKFQSLELQEYFGSKSWYHGTIEPDAFSESVFNATEKKNIDLLKEREYALSPKGYALY